MPPRMQQEVRESWAQGRYCQVLKSLLRLWLWSRFAVCPKGTSPQHPQRPPPSGRDPTLPHQPLASPLPGMQSRRNRPGK